MDVVGVSKSMKKGFSICDCYYIYYYNHSYFQKNEKITKIMISVNEASIDYSGRSNLHYNKIMLNLMFKISLNKGFDFKGKEGLLYN